MNKFLLSEKQIKLVENAIAFHEDTRGYYYFYPRSYASGRRSKEREMNAYAVNETIDCSEVLKTKTKPVKITIKQSYEESCKNVYVVSQVFVNEKKSTFLKLKNILNNLVE